MLTQLLLLSTLMCLGCLVTALPYDLYEPNDIEESQGYHDSGTWLAKRFRDNYLTETKDYGDLDDDRVHDVNYLTADKRGGRLPVVFVCSPKTAACKNGGRGPRITPLKTRKLAMCVCLCPNQLKGAQCTKVRRRRRW